MSMLIIAFIILLVVWFAAKSQKPKNRRSGQPELTDTQRRWHANKARERLEDINNNLTKSLERLDAPTRQTLQKLMDMRDYIAAHKRPFKFSEWLMWEVEPKFLTKYCTWMILYYAVSFSPMLWGWPVSIFFMTVWWLIIDSMFYKQKLVLEVTEWNPEWHEKFGEKDK
ncbi:hypothetical protein LCGC14_1139560 [marine sediment metagenome]|uniref:Uncharacterized protein n=1 Tax=marine sediment metagenome TaxID=412755 RepID=A0A0F9LYP7_9ZZZZ